MQAYHPLPFGTLALPTIHKNCLLTVTIPAKDEADYIVPTLDALRQQYSPSGKQVDYSSYEVIILANNCRDDTVGVIRRYADRYPAFRLHVVTRRLPESVAAVGTARRLLMDTAFHRFLGIDRLDGAICTTDADTLVHANWAHYTLQSISNGAQAVGGRIIVPATDRASDQLYRKHHLLDVTYRSLQYCLESMIDPDPADPWPRHFQHFGPSTALTASAYRACGGIPPLRCLEDVGLVDALLRVGIPVTHNRNVKVYTSSRASDRVAGTAFSHQLDDWSRMTAERETQRVVGLANCRRLYKWKVLLRRACSQPSIGLDPQLGELATALFWPLPVLRARIKQAQSYEQLYLDVRQRLVACPKFANTDISVAIKELRVFTSSLRHRSFGIGPGGTAPPGRRARSESYHRVVG